MLKEKADYLVLQEVRLCKDSLRGAKKRARMRGWEVVNGKPCGTKFKKNNGSGRFFRKESSRVVKQGGVLTLAKEGNPILTTGRASGVARKLHDTGRWVRSAIPVGDGRALHIGNMHNNPGTTRIDATQK